MNTEIKPIETRYKGYRFRSRLEARWAVFFDTMEFKWEYEPEGFVLPSGNYLPDFRLFLRGDKSVYIEVKGEDVDDHTGEHVEKCRELAEMTNCCVLLLVGMPAYRMYNQLAPGLPPNNFQAAFFVDWAGHPSIEIADEYWFCQVEGNEDTGALEFPFDDRQAKNAFGRGYMDAVKAARAARFEHGESP